MRPAGPALTASASVEVAAGAETAYAVLTDLDALADLAEETESMVWKRGAAPRPGAVFTGANRNGARTWSTTCRVTHAEPGRRFGFEVSAGPLRIARWQYDLEDLGPDRCRVTESTWDRRPGWFKRPGGWLTGVQDRDRISQEHIEATLARLQDRFADPPAPLAG